MLDEEHPDLANTLDNLGTFYYEQQKYNEAEPLAERALKIRSQRLTAKNPSLAFSLHNLALIYCDQGKYEAAEPLFLEAIRIAETVWSENHPDFNTIRDSFEYFKTKKQNQETKFTNQSNAARIITRIKCCLRKIHR